MKINDSILVQLLRHKRDALSDLWSFIKRFIIDTWATYKRTADHFCMPRSTVGWHMKIRLQDLDLGLYNKVQNITYASYTERFARWSESLEG